jgi:hypothetical protein
MTQTSELYEQDFQRWIERQLELLKRGKTADIDVEHLIAELEDMGRSNVRELESRFIVLVAHLLKWQYQRATLADQWREFEGRSWRSTIIEQRAQIAFLLSKVPSLRRSLQPALTEAYPEARRVAIRETGLDAQTFPAQCPYSVLEVLDHDFYPNSPRATHATPDSAGN